MIKNIDHPWGNFLTARFYAILWLKDEFGHSDKQIAEILSMDEMQVYLIRGSTHLQDKEEEG
jgi:hypothetical protein